MGSPACTRQARTSINLSWLPKVRLQIKQGKAGWGEAPATILPLASATCVPADKGDGLGGGGNGGAAAAGPVARKCPSSLPGVIGSSAVARLVQLVPVDRLPPFWNFVMAGRSPGWRASPMRHARKPYRARSRRLVPSFLLRRMHRVLSKRPFGCLPCVEIGAADNLRRRESLPSADQGINEQEQQGTREATARAPLVAVTRQSSCWSRVCLPIGARQPRIDP